MRSFDEIFQDGYRLVSQHLPMLQTLPLPRRHPPTYLPRPDHEEADQAHPSQTTTGVRLFTQWLYDRA